MKHLFTFPFLCFLLLTHLDTQGQITKDDLADKQYGLQTATATGFNYYHNQLRFPPAAPAATGDNLCGPGFAANLTATASGGGTLNWYNVATGGTALATGTTFSPVVTTTTDYWVEEVVGGSGGTQNLATPYNSNNGQRGCMFDVTATNTVTVTHFDANLYAGTTANYEIYYRAGTHVGFEANAAAWTLLGGATGITSAGNNLPTPLPINFSVTIPAGQTYSFYVTNDFGGGTSYTDGVAVGGFWASDANLTVYEGVGKSYPFGLTFNVRNFNGTIHYTTGGGASASPRTLVTANVREPDYTPNASTTISNANCTVTEAGVDWTYYYHTADPNKLLFAIAHDPNNLGNNSFSAEVEITVKNNPGTTCYQRVNAAEGLGRFVMGRYWNVDVTSGSIVDPVWIRFYYKATEKAGMNTVADAWRVANGGVQSPMYFFKTDGVPFSIVGSLHKEGVYSGLELTNLTDNQNTINGKNYVEIQNINSFSGGGLITGVVPVGGTTSGTAILLDLTLLDFTAKKIGETVDLSWTTKEEFDMSHFVLERSLDGTNFKAIGTVEATNEIEKTIHYLWNDAQPYSGVNYYRLKMIEANGAFTYSAVRAIAFDEKEAYTLRVLPNPFQNALTLNVQAEVATEAIVMVYNGLGQVIYTRSTALELGETSIEIDAAQNWDAGCYTVIIRSNQFTQQKQVIKN